MLSTIQITKIKNIVFFPYPSLPKGPIKWVWVPSVKSISIPSPEVFFFLLIIFFTSQVSLVTKNKKIEDDSFLKKFLGQLEKWPFCHIYENWSSSIKDTSIRKLQIKKIKCIMESPNLVC